MSLNKGKYLCGIFGHEEVLMKSISKIKGAGVRIHEVYAPYPLHGLDELLGYKRSRIDIAAFMFGITGTCCALTMMISMLTIDWPMIIGGKSPLPFPDLIPITFEMTVLFSALGMVGTFFVVSGMYPGKKPFMFDVRSVDDKFVMAVELAKNNLHEDEIRRILAENGAEEVNEKVID